MAHPSAIKLNSGKKARSPDFRSRLVTLSPAKGTSLFATSLEPRLGLFLMRVSFNGAGLDFSKVTIWVRIPALALVGGNRTETILRPYDDRPSHMEAANHIQRSRVLATQEPHKLRYVGSNPASAIGCRVSCQGREPAVLKHSTVQA